MIVLQAQGTQFLAQVYPVDTFCNGAIRRESDQQVPFLNNADERASLISPI
jgi:hypothetical protein